MRETDSRLARSSSTTKTVMLLTRSKSLSRPTLQRHRHGRPLTSTAPGPFPSLAAARETSASAALARHGAALSLNPTEADRPLLDVEAAKAGSALTRHAAAVVALAHVVAEGRVEVADAIARAGLGVSRAEPET